MTLTTGTDQTIDREVLLRIFETASRIRAFDDKAQALIGSAQAFFVHYPVRGHEIISAVRRGGDRADRLHDRDLPRHRRRGRQGRAAARAVGRDAGQGDRHLQGPGWPDAHRRPRSRADAVHRHRRWRPAGGSIGLGLASQLQGDGRVTICNFGDGATNIGAFHESLNMASVWSLPVVFVCQNNQYGEHTKFADTQKTASVVDRAAAYAMKGIKVDGMDPAATYDGRPEAVDHARRGDGPVLLECVTFRTLGHVLSDKNEYMDPDEPVGPEGQRPAAPLPGVAHRAGPGRRGHAGRHRGPGRGRGRRRLRAGRRRPAGRSRHGHRGRVRRPVGGPERAGRGRHPLGRSSPSGPPSPRPSTRP